MTDFTEATIPTEGTASTTFTWTPDAAVQVESNYKSVNRNFENGSSLSFSKLYKNRREWKLNFAYRDETERDEIFAFINSRVGSEEAFNWTPPEGSALKVCCIGEPVSDKIAPDVYSIVLNFQEVF